MTRKLRIAQIGSIWETTPPKLYGGTERIVSLLTEELVNRGHDVTLFATGDSKTKAHLVSVVPHALYRMKIPWSNITYPLMHIYEAYRRVQEFDVFHIHLNIISDYASLIFSEFIKIPTIYTFHFNLPTKDSPYPDRYYFLKKFAKLNYISISNSQRAIKSLNYIATVYNGIDVNKYDFNSRGGDYIMWLGRFAPGKGPAEAIKASLLSKKKLILAGKLDLQDKASQQYYYDKIDQSLKKEKKLVRYIGEIDDRGKNKWLGPARCLVNPINWREPFGLVIAEANACGTPVVAFESGSMPEVIKDGVNGFLVKKGDVKAMARKVREIYEMSDLQYRKLRETSREFVEKNFSYQRMTDDYEKIYLKILNARQ